MINSNENPEKKSGGKLLAGLIIGGAIASVLGIHLTPKKTQNLLKKKARRIWGKIEDKIHELEENEE
ncbi:MAG: YtxH domain-containing protein [Patescibacteria group bacterium]|jgi:gas vesicle protein